MEEIWVTLGSQYPEYDVSNLGQIRNNRSGRVIAQSKNNTGFMKVAINDFRGDRRTVEVTRLVAFNFVQGYSPQNDTPIHLDGNREHTFADNLAWRPRWFAVLFHKQFHDPRYHIDAPILEPNLKRVFPNSLEAAKALGVLEQHIMLSTVNGTPTYPDGYTFEMIAA